ncbi:MAG: hypothetical protein AAF787_01395, partial [Chloroflexota bacterium]
MATEQNPQYDDDFADNEVVRRTSEMRAVNAEPADDSIWWVVAFCGLLLTVAGGVVLAQTLQLLAEGTAAWSDCIRSTDNTLFSACGDELNVAFVYRVGGFGMNGLLAMGLAIAACFIGPVPMIAAFSRYRSTWLGGVMFFVVLIPYGTLAFFVLI